MKVRGDSSPSAAFSLEDIPKKPGMLLARFFANAHKVYETYDSTTAQLWEWDEYHMELRGYPALPTDIEANIQSYLEQAISIEAEQMQLETLSEENRILKAQVEAQSSQMDFYEDCIVEMAGIVYG